MPSVVMSNPLSAIMLLLKNSIGENYNVTNVDAIHEAVSRLESFPMSMNHLQDTRIGHILQSIRHNVEPSLQKRIRFIIKSWQKLLSSDFTHPFIIPLHHAEKSSCLSNNKSNGTNVPTSTPAAPTPISSRLSATIPEKNNSISSRPPGLNNNNHLDSTNMSHKRPHNSGSFAIQRSSLSDTNLVNNFGRATAKNSQHLECPNSLSQSSTTPSKRIKLSTNRSLPSSTFEHPRTSDLVVNGTGGDACRPSKKVASKEDLVRSTSDPKTIATSNQIVRLAKVKSTVELIQAAGDCIDSVTADRILTVNRWNKEISEPRKVPPSTTAAAASLTTVSSSVRTPKQTRPTYSANHIRAPATAESTVASRLMPESFDVKVTNKDHRDKDAVINSLPTSSPPKPTYDALASADTVLKERPDDTNCDSTDCATMTAAATITTTKKKKKKHSKHDTVSTSCLPPVTNHMDDWPHLPPLPDQIDWFSLDRGMIRPGDNTQGVCDKNDDDGGGSSSSSASSSLTTFHDPTELQSVALDDQYLHILPWVDMFGYRRKFFPTNIDHDLAQLTELPEPW